MFNQSNCSHIIRIRHRQKAFGADGRTCCGCWRKSCCGGGCCESANGMQQATGQSQQANSKDDAPRVRQYYPAQQRPMNRASCNFSNTVPAVGGKFSLYIRENKRGRLIFITPP